MNTMEKFGEALQKERLNRDISLEEISDKTNLNINILKAMEEDDFSIIPGKFYYMRFVENYLKVLDIDKNSFFEKNSPSYSDEDEGETLLYSKLSYSRFRKKSFITLLILTILLIAGAYVLTVYYDLKLPDDFSVFKKEKAVLPAVYADLSDHIPDSHLDEAPVRIKMEFVEDCWVSISRSGSVIDQALHKKGETFSTEGYSFKVTIGKASGVKMFINGSEVSWLEDKKGTLQMNIEPSTIANYLGQ